MKKNIEVKSNYFDLYANVTSDDLRSVANAMDANEIKHIKFYFDAGYNSVDITGKRMITEYATRLETDKEYNFRLQKQKEHKEQQLLLKEKERKQIINKARKLGITAQELEE